MRPPSYYASIVKSNTGQHGSPYSSSSYGSPASDYSGAPRTPSRELRSSLSSAPSSSYVSRSHLPFVPQSTLVAHCIAGVGSSTRPYGSSAPSSYHRSASSYSAASLRPSSTKRSSGQYSGASSSGYSSAGSSYLAPSSAARSGRYSGSGLNVAGSRPSATASSYYKPIRLRERPLLTQISRQIESARPSKPSLRSTTTSHSSASETQSERVESSAAGQPRSISTSAGAQPTPPANLDESNWSSDIGRNISRNKYLIKFREFEKHSRPSVDVEATIQLPAGEPAPERDTPADLIGESSVALTVVHTMRLPTPDPQRPETRDEGPHGAAKWIEPKCDNKAEVETGAATATAATTTKERKNVKLKLKPIGGPAGSKKKKSDTIAEATTTTTVTSRVGPEKASQKSTEPSPKIDETPREVEKTEEPRGPTDQPTETTQTEPALATPKLAKALEKKATKTSLARGKKKGQEPTEGNNENKDAAPEPKIPSLKATPSKTNDDQPPKPTTPKTRRASKPVVDERPDGKELPAECEKSKTKLVKKKKKKVEDETETGDKSNNVAPRKPSREKAPDALQAAEEVRTPAPSFEAKKPPTRIRFRKYNIDDFNFLTVLGHGGWGFVILAELKQHDACFAVKCIKKITIVEDDDYDSIMIERRVLTLGNIQPFICKLFCTFETPGYLFFVMEYCAGGDLMFHVQHEGKFSESRCRFYAAEIICAIRFLHNRHIIYRDLKLDNILLDARGHIRLVDFGMCQCRTYREEMLPSNFCGTPEYISPEIIKGVPYNHSVDWWSFGVLLYEMAVGKMPFRGNDENELLWNVCYEQIHYPMFLTKELTYLLKSLLERDPSKRMGMATCKAGDIYNQPFFRNVDWKAVEELRVEPPFVPEVRSNRDVSNFDSDFTESTCQLSPVDEGTLARIDQKQFEKFPYTNPDIFIFDPTQQNSPELLAGQRSTAIF